MHETRNENLPKRPACFWNIKNCWWHGQTNRIADNSNEPYECIDISRSYNYATFLDKTSMDIEKRLNYYLGSSLWLKLYIL